MFYSEMKKHGRTVYLALLLAVLPALTAAQESESWMPGPDRALTQEALVNAVVERNARLSVRQLRARAKRELIESADALEDPRFSYSVAPGSAGDDIPSDLGNALGIRQVYQVSQAIPWPGKLGLRTDLAEAEAEIEQFTHDELLLSLADRSRALWGRLWFADRALAANTAHRRLLENLEEVAQTRYANGLGPQENLLRIQTSLVELRHRETVLNQERRRILARINALLNQAPVTDLGSPAAGLPDPALPQPDAVRERMLQRQPELLVLEARAEAARTRLRLEEMNDMPDFQLNMGYNELRNDSSLRFQIGLSINIPLDLGGKRSARKSAAGFEYRSTRADVARLMAELDAELEEQRSRHDELTSNIALSETELIPVAEQTFNAARASYEGGGGNFATLVEAQRQLLDLRLELARMRSEKFMALSGIDRLSGGMIWPLEDMQ